MAFRIGTNTQGADAGRVQGTQREIEFDYTLTVLEKAIRAKLIYYQTGTESAMMVEIMVYVW